MTKINKLILKGELLNLFIKYNLEISQYLDGSVQFEEVLNLSKELDKILKIK